MEEVEKRLSRRGFLRRTAAGAAAVGFLASAPSALVSLGGLIGDAQAAPPGTAANPLVAYVRDPSGGEIVVMAGTKEVVQKNPGLVTTLLRIAQE